MGVYESNTTGDRPVDASKKDLPKWPEGATWNDMYPPATKKKDSAAGGDAGLTSPTK